MKIKKIELTQLECERILTNAIETHAIDYWALDYQLIKIWHHPWDDKNEEQQGLIHKARLIADHPEQERKTLTLEAADIQRGVDRLLDGSVKVSDDIIEMIVEDDNDADSCDCIIQAALFNQIVFG